jgi:hypothetical protein
MLSVNLKIDKMIKKIMILLLILTSINPPVDAQVYYTKNGSISFFSKGILQNIEADNNQVISVMNVQTGTIEFSLLNNSFHFEKAKMEEDFNENYIESDKYPRSTFKGIIKDIGNLNFSKDGTFTVNIKGDLTIHGVTKNITTTGTINIVNGKISATSTFNVLVKDYKINIPTIVTNKIAESIEVKVHCNYEKK